MLTYSVLIPTCDRPLFLKKALRCLEQQTINPAEVIIIDQSTNGETQILFNSWSPAFFPRLKKKYIHLDVKSLVKARNAGIDACGETDLVWFLDDDATVNAEFASSLVAVFEKDKVGKYAGGTGHIDGFEKKRKYFSHFFWMPHEGKGDFLPSGQPTYLHWKKEFSETDFISGGCTIWRRAIISEYRYDERLVGYGYGEDVDASFRISRKFKNFYQPTAIVFLHSPPLDKKLAKDSRRVFRRAWMQNFYYLSIKNDISMPAFFWCVFGYCLRDLLCFDFQSLWGDWEGLKNIFNQKINTVEGFNEFKQRVPKEF